MSNLFERASKASSEIANRAEKKLESDGRLSSSEERKLRAIIKANEDLHLMLGSYTDSQLEKALNADKEIKKFEEKQPSINNMLRDLSDKTGIDVPINMNMIDTEQMLGLHEMGMNRLEWGVKELERITDDGDGDGGGSGILYKVLFILILITAVIMPGGLILLAIVIYLSIVAWFFFLLEILSQLIGGKSESIAPLRKRLNLPVLR